MSDTRHIAASSGDSHPNEHQRIDDDSWETAQVGVEYYSPDQLGGIHGTIIRQFFSGTMAGVGKILVENGGITKIFAQGGYSGKDDGAVLIPVASYGTATSTARAFLDVTNDDLELLVGTSFDSGDYEIWVDYQ